MISISPSENTQVLANTFLAAAFEFGLSHPANEDQLRGKKQFLELDTVYQRVSTFKHRKSTYRPSSRIYTIVWPRRPHAQLAPFDARGRICKGGAPKRTFRVVRDGERGALYSEVSPFSFLYPLYNRDSQHTNVHKWRLSSDPSPEFERFQCTCIVFAKIDICIP